MSSGSRIRKRIADRIVTSEQVKNDPRYKSLIAIKPEAYKKKMIRFMEAGYLLALKEVRDLCQADYDDMKEGMRASMDKLAELIDDKMNIVLQDETYFMDLCDSIVEKGKIDNAQSLPDVADQLKALGVSDDLLSMRIKQG